MSEEEIINKVEHICRVKDFGDEYTRSEVEAIDGLLDLYNKEKEKNKELFTQEDINKENEIGYSQGVYFTDEAWKDKIREKIEEINKEELNYNENDYWVEQEMKGYAIDHIQKLLEKGI